MDASHQGPKQPQDHYNAWTWDLSNSSCQFEKQVFSFSLVLGNTRLQIEKGLLHEGMVRL